MLQVAHFVCLPFSDGGAFLLPYVQRLRACPISGIKLPDCVFLYVYALSNFQESDFPAALQRFDCDGTGSRIRSCSCPGRRKVVAGLVFHWEIRKFLLRRATSFERTNFISRCQVGSASILPCRPARKVFASSTVLTFLRKTDRDGNGVVLRIFPELFLNLTAVVTSREGSFSFGKVSRENYDCLLPKMVLER